MCKILLQAWHAKFLQEPNVWEESPDRVLLQLPSDCVDHQLLCYNITATNGVQTVIVEGCIDNSEWHFLCRNKYIINNIIIISFVIAYYRQQQST